VIFNFYLGLEYLDGRFLQSKWLLCIFSKPKTIEHICCNCNAAKKFILGLLFGIVFFFFFLYIGNFLSLGTKGLFSWHATSREQHTSLSLEVCI